ncbi:hypothetical protein RFI_15657 [Reticulomyxa filosa]|uniref:Uncharacterized protein n=1 Tax=Reticulomyxa filosa TaxID=46433 RepID=X6N8B9_RETFI|nr:hypothetical protein RFI_15657 [Reticulomyxa filosa]|eukprot:ETO21547.1 hypothetical protein RFI_15657 [Reticulomyxa filosa]
MISLSSGSEKGEDILFTCYWVGICIIVLTLLLFLSFWNRDDIEMTSADNQHPFERCVRCAILRKQTYKTISHVLTLCAMLSALLYMGLAMGSYHQLSSNYEFNCKIGLWAPAVGYFVHKFFIYECLTLRLQSSFSGSAYAYKPWLLATLHSVVTGCLITEVTLMCIAYEREKISKGKNSDKYFCVVKYPIWCTVTFAAMDMFVNVVLLYLFMKPLIVLARQQHWYTVESHIIRQQTTLVPNAPLPFPSDVSRISSNKAKELAVNSILYNLLVRVNVVTWTMVLTTITNMVVYIFTLWTLGFILDLIINSLCLLFTFGKFTSFYRITCRCCHCFFSAIGVYLLYKVQEYN